MVDALEAFQKHMDKVIKLTPIVLAPDPPGTLPPATGLSIDACDDTHTAEHRADLVFSSIVDVNVTGVDQEQFRVPSLKAFL